MTPRNTTVGFVGLGNLGQAMARRLLSTGWPLQVVDLVPDRAADLVEAGAHLIEPGRTAEALAQCEVIAFAVPDEQAIWTVLRDDGLLDRLTDHHVVLIHSTVLPERVRELAEAVGATGARCLDAPVSGGADRAEHGDLAIFVGAESDDLTTARPFLDAIGGTIAHLGPVGAGAAAKLANQLVTFATVAGLHEALDLAGRYEVAEDDLISALSSGIADSWQVRNWGFFDRTARDYDEANVRDEDRPWVKDLREAAEAADAVGLELPVADTVRATIGQRIEQHAASGSATAGAR